MTTPTVGSARVRIVPDFGDFSGLLVSGINNSLSAIEGAAIAATTAIVGLAASISKLGLEQANVLQTGSIAFESLTSEILGTANATEVLGEAQRKAIGDDFLQSLREIAVQSSITLKSLISASQAFLAIGYSGDQAKNTILTISNALAASGKAGAELNQSLGLVVKGFTQSIGAGRLLAQDLNQITSQIPSAGRDKVYLQIAESLGLVSSKAKLSVEDLVRVRVEISKMAGEGQISSDVGIFAIMKALQEIPGAVDKATMAAQALERVNEQTLGGAFEEISDRFRQELGAAFLDAGDEIVPKLSAFGDRVSELVGNFVPPLTTLVTGVVDILTDNADAISKGLGVAFKGLSDALTAVAPHIPEVITGIRDLFDTLNDLKLSTEALTAITVVTAFINPLAALVPLTLELQRTPGVLDDLKQAFENVKPALEPITSILSSIGQVFLSLGPVIVGLSDVVVVFTPLLKGLAAGFGLLADALSLVLNSKLGEIIGFILGMRLAVAALSLALTLTPFGAVAAAIVILAAAFAYGWEHSEKFREIMVWVFHTIAEAATASVRLILYALEKVWSGLDNASSKIPLVGKYLGKGFDTAADAARSLRGEIDAMVDSINKIPTATKPKVLKDDFDMRQHGPAFPKITQQPQLPKLVAPIYDPAAQNALERIREQERLAKEAAAEAERAAKAAAAAIKSAIKNAFNDVDSIRKHIEEKSIDQIDDQFANLFDHLRDANRGYLIEWVASYETYLKGLAAERDKMKDSLDEASSALKNLQSEATNFETSIKNSITALGNVTDPTKGIRTTIAGIKNNLQGAIALAEQFSSTVEQLQSLGLNEASIRQILEAGPKAGLAAAKELVKSGADGIGKINELQSKLTGISSGFSKTVTDSFYQNGISAAEGLVAGFQSKEQALKDEMIRITDVLIVGLQKALKISSPSKLVWDKVGSPVLDGMIPTNSAVSAAMNKLTTGININPITMPPKGTDKYGSYQSQSESRPGSSYSATITVPVTVQGVSGVPDQQKAQILGDTVADIIARRQQTMMLNGMA